MAGHPRTRALADLGQSLWLDYIQRSLLSGELERLVESDAITGLTANPTIFEKAIAGSSDYDEALRLLAPDRSLDAQAILERLAFADIQHAADILRPVYERTSGADGFVSIEVSPELANDTEGTLAQVRRYWAAIERPNLLVKIPGTPAGVPAIREALTEGINVNVTLLFSVSQYEAVALAHLDALEARLAKRLPVDRLASVASFFVSRVDTLLDAKIDAAVARKAPGAGALLPLRSQLGIANSKLAFARFQELTQSPRWQALAQKARPQRVLWASTSTKDPKLPDVRYVEALAGPGTIDTLPPETLAAFVDHGEAKPRLTEGLAEARAQVAALQKNGLSLAEACEELQVDGVKKFTASIVALRKTIDQKVEALRREAPSQAPVGPTETALGQIEARFRERAQRLAGDGFVQRLWGRDPTLWKNDPAHEKVIRHRLGWLDVADRMVSELPRLRAFVGAARAEGIRHAVLCGMGGSSLAPEVFRETFGSKAGFPELHVLDSTAPGAIRALEGSIDLERSIFLVSSKSGGTLETLSFFRYFREKVAAFSKRPGERFAAITDPGSGLEALARKEGFREIFLNPSDIGGRYSALSLFGLVPAALIGVDLDGLLERTLAMQRACREPSATNPGLALGAALAEAAQAGRAAVTLVAPRELSSFGVWAEQLLAESTGKEGKGLVPVDGEPLGPASVYGDDRLFARLALGGQPAGELPGPSVTLRVPSTLDLGAEFYRWEFATAVACALFGIDSFDEPNVQESKDNTGRILASGTPAQAPLLSAGQVALFASGLPASDLGAALRAFAQRAPEHGYFALQAYLPPDEKSWAELQRIRTLLRDRTRRATTVGWGPRFLHSTGQLHKGGPQLGSFLQLTSDGGPKLPIPGAAYDFGALIAAQADGDLLALRQRTDRVVRLRLSGEPAAALEEVRRALDRAL